MISVIVPVYNSERYIKNCLESILCQTYRDLEIILVDDGSTDRSGLICDEFYEKDSRVKVIHKQNAGVSAARNDGLAIATGEYISFVDSDDELEPDMFELLLRNAQNHEAEISHCGYKRVDDQRNLIKEVSGTGTILVQNCSDAIQCMLEGRYFVGGLWNKLFAARVIKDIQFDTDLKNTEDILFCVLAFQKAEQIVFEDKTKYIYYEHPTSACNTMSRQKQICDAVSGTRVMLENACNDALRDVYQSRLFGELLSLYQFSLKNKDCSLRPQEIKEDLVSEKRNTKKVTRRLILKYILVVHFWPVYKTIYRIYDRLRKPNWDVK